MTGTRCGLVGMATRPWEILNSIVRRPCFLLASRDGHPSSSSILVTLACRSQLLTVKRAALRWTISSLLMLFAVCGSHTDDAYSNVGLTRVL